MKKIMATLLISLVVLLSACSTNESSSDSEMMIYTSIYPIQYFTERIGGEYVQAQSIYPPGVDAHTYEPTAKTMANIAKGDAFIYLGAGFEGFAQSASEALASSKVQLAELGTHEDLFAEVDHNEHEEESSHHNHNHGDKDPHVWLDPLRAQVMAKHIKEELVSLSPEHKAQFDENFQSLVHDLNSLHEEFKAITQKADQNKLLVSHAAYGYWEQRYGLEQISVSGISPNSEPSQKEIVELIDTVEEENINHMIFEQNVSNQVASIIQEQIGAEPLTVHNLSVRTEQNIEANQDYLSLMKQNIEVLQEALNE